MRILHTSDWHLGATFYGRSRRDEQVAFLDWLRKLIVREKVDALVVAGDVFDTGNPSADALGLYYGFLAGLAEDARTQAETSAGGKRVAIVVGGNHDSPSRLDAPRDVLASLSTHVVGGFDDDRDEPGERRGGRLVPLYDGRGQVRVVVAAVPYLNEQRLGVGGFSVSESEQLSQMHDRFRAVYTQLADDAERLYPGAKRIATGHLTCFAERGRKASEEDGIPIEIHRVGSLGAMAPSIFDERFQYVALGHIHRGFPVESTGRVRYSGTPVQVSAVEGADDRRVWLVDLSDDAPKATPVAVPVTRRLVAFDGTYAEVQQKISDFRAPEGEEPAYAVVTATLDAPDLAAHDKLIAHAAARHKDRLQLVEVRTSVPVAERAAALAVPDAARLTPEVAFLWAWKRAHGDSDPDASILQKFRSLVSDDGEHGGSAR